MGLITEKRLSSLKDQAHGSGLFAINVIDLILSGIAAGFRWSRECALLAQTESRAIMHSNPFYLAVSCSGW
jgi:hypothetical protein